MNMLRRRSMNPSLFYEEEHPTKNYSENGIINLENYSESGIVRTSGNAERESNENTKI